MLQFLIRIWATCYTALMWPFKKKEPEKRGGKIVKRLVVGFVIGSAVSSIIGSRLRKQDEDDEDDDEGDEA